MNTKTKQSRPASNNKPASTTALAALLQRSTRLQRESHSKNPFQKRSALPPLHRIGEDGVDHINVAVGSTTELGQILSTRQMLAFTYDIFGQFMSIDGLMYYARSVHHDDMFRELPPIKGRARAEREPMKPALPNFRAVGIDAMFQRIKQYPEILKAVSESTLPFDMYTVGERNMRQRPVDAEWIVEGLERIRKALKDKHTPLLLDYLDEGYRLPSNSVPIKTKLAHQRRAIRLQFISAEELDVIEAQEAEEAKQRIAEAAARREQRAAAAEATGDAVGAVDVVVSESTVDSAEINGLPPVELPEGAVAIPGLHLTTDAAVVVEGAGPGNYVDVARDEAAPAAKTLVNTECKGPHMVSTFDDGSTEVVQLNDPTCGNNTAAA